MSEWKQETVEGLDTSAPNVDSDPQIPRIATFNNERAVPLKVRDKKVLRRPGLKTVLPISWAWRKDQ